MTASSGIVGSRIGETLRDKVGRGLSETLERMEIVPKTMKWKVRAKVGTKVKWYQDVKEIQDAGDVLKML